MRFLLSLAGGFCGSAMCDLVFHTGPLGQLAGGFLGAAWFVGLWVRREDFLT